MKYLITLLLLVGCSAKPPVGDDWITVWGKNKLPVGSYSPKTDEAMFYSSAEEAFKQLMKAVIESEAARAKAVQAPAPVTPKKK